MNGMPESVQDHDEHQEKGGMLAFFEQERGRLIGYLRKRGCSCEDAEDIIQCVGLHLFGDEAWKTFDENKASLKTWLIQNVLNKYRDFQRKKKRRRSISTQQSSGETDWQLGDRGEEDIALRRLETRELIERIGCAFIGRRTEDKKRWQSLYTKDGWQV